LVSLPFGLLDVFGSALVEVSDFAPPPALLSLFELAVGLGSALAPSLDVDGFESPVDSLFESLDDDDSGPDVRCAFFP